MSGGEQQRVSIARALVNNPEILIADEPSSNIDAKAIENLISILTDLREKGMTIIISTHDSVFYPHADIKINLKEGVLINIEQRAQKIMIVNAFTIILLFIAVISVILGIVTLFSALSLLEGGKRV